jgi:hypothetical protein
MGGQALSLLLYNVQFACDTTKGGNGLPIAGPGAFESASILGVNSTLPSGVAVQIRGLDCYGDNGQLLTNLSVGSSFTGLLWINYTLNGAAPGSDNPYHTTIESWITVKVT